MKKRPTTIATALTAAAAAASPAKAAITDADALEQDVAREVNEARAERGLVRLRISWNLSRAAEAKSRSMGAHGYFGHDEPDGQPFWRQIVRYYTVRGFRSWKVGQTLLWTVPSLSAHTIVERWLASPPHREVLLKREFREAGVSAIRVTHATGFYGGRNVTIVTLNVGFRTR